MSGKSKFWKWIDHKVRVTISDRRMMIGTFIGFDKHLNVILADCEEIRIVKPKNSGQPLKEIKRPMGLMVIRGDCILSITAAKSPHLNLEKKLTFTSLGPGKVAPIQRDVEFDQEEAKVQEPVPKEVPELN